jgi:hypothetical protein
MTRVPGSRASSAMPWRMLTAPTSACRSRPPVPMAWLTPPPRRWIWQVTSCSPVPEAATSPMAPRRTALAKPSGTPPTMAVPQSGPMTRRPRRSASRLRATSCASGTLSLNRKTSSPSASAFKASAAA